MSDSTQPLPPGELFRHAEFMKRLARGLLRDEQAAEDVAQDAFVLALERPPSASGTLAGWFARVARNLALNRRKAEQRRAQREERVARAESDDTDQRATERLELQRAVAELVLRLDGAKRTALYLRYYEDLEPQAIAERLGVPVKTVKTRLARALAELRAELDEREQGDRSAWAAALVPLVAAEGVGVLAATGVVGGLLMKKAIVAVVLVLAAGILWRHGREGEPSSEASTTNVTTWTPPPEPAEVARETKASEDAHSSRTPASVPVETMVVVQVVRLGTAEPLSGVGLVLHEASAAWGFEETSASRGGPGSLRTDASGRAEFRADSGTSYGLEANSGGGELIDTGMGNSSERLEPLAPGETRELVVSLPSGFDLGWCGEIMDGETRLTLAGARVERVVGDPFTMHTGQETARSSGDGRVQLQFASWHPCYARVELDGYAPGFVRLEKGHESPATALPVRLLRAATLELIISDSEGVPLADIEVRLSFDAEELVQGSRNISLVGDEVSTLGRTDEHGRCIVERLPAQDALTLELLGDGRSLRREERFLRLEPGERRTLHWTVGGPCRVSGQIVEADGRPAPGVLVWAVPQNGEEMLRSYEKEGALGVRSDLQGSFTLELAAGAWRIGPAPIEPQSEIAPVATPLVIAPGQASAELRLAAWRGLYLKGRVFGPDGESIREGHVTALSASAIATDSLRDGTFTLGPLPPGAFVVRASPFPGTAGLSPSGGASYEAGTEDIELVLRRASSLSVRVRDAQGKATPDAMVWVLAAPGTEGSSGGTFTAGDGTASLPNLVPGLYAVSASSPMGEFALLTALDLAAGEAREVELSLAPAARLRLEILPRSEPRMHVEIRQAGQPIALLIWSEYPVAPLPPGEYELVLKGFRGGGAEELARQNVRVAAEGETLAVFNLEAR